MITVRRGKGRHCERHHKREVWLTFYPQDRTDPLSDGFGTLELLNEERLPPGADVRLRPPHDSEIVRYVHEGALACEDRTGDWGVIQAGEFQRMTGGHGRGEKNASKTDWAHIFWIQLRPSRAGREIAWEQKRFSAADRRGRLCAVASPDTRGGSLRIHQDVLMYSAMLDPGQHVVHELSPGRSAWLHVVKGVAGLGDIILATGDGAGITGESAVSITAIEPSSILLLDVGHVRPADSRALPENRGADELSGAALFRKLWEGLVDVLGPAATAAIVGRSARRALARSPEMSEFAITRVDGEFGYVLPPSFDGAAVGFAPLQDLLDQIHAPLVQLTGRVVFRHLERIPELHEWATRPPPQLAG